MFSARASTTTAMEMVDSFEQIITSDVHELDIKPQPLLKSCIVRRIRTWTFPKPKDGKPAKVKLGVKLNAPQLTRTQPPLRK